MLKALLWDVDGTIAETERDGHRVAFNLAFAELGLPWGWDEAHYRRLLAVTGGRERLLADMAQRPEAPAGAERRETLARQLHTAKNRHYAALVAQGCVAPRPGVLPLMREARAQGLQQAIATTTSRANVDALMPGLLGPHWQAHFQAVLCGEDTQRKKPDPEVYVRALARLGLRPDQALALEDSGPGVAAALGAGLPVCWRPGADSPPLQAQLSAQVRACGEHTPFHLAALQDWHRQWRAGTAPPA